MGIPGSDGLLFAYVFDGQGQARPASWLDIRRELPEGSFLWIHLLGSGGRVSQWLAQESGIPPSFLDAMVEDNPNPRCETAAGATLLILRSVTLLAGAIPNELHTVRIFVDSSRVVSVQRYPVAAIADVEDLVSRGRGPKDTGELVAELAERLIDRMDVVIGDLMQQVDALEDQAMGDAWRSSGGDVARLRLHALAMKRALAPQREALNKLYFDRQPWICDADRRRLHEASNQAMRMADDLNAIRERAALVTDQLAERRSDDMNRNMLILTMVTVGLAPMNLVSSMLGMNVGGIPGNTDEHAFWFISLVFVLGALAAAYWFRKVFRI